MTRLDIDRPLAGFKVVDLVASPLSAISRYLAELGADVCRLEIAGRQAHSAKVPGSREHLAYLAANLGKHVDTCCIADLAEKLEGADLIVEDLSSDPDCAHALDLAQMRVSQPDQVVLTVSGFGKGNSFSDWQWTDAVLHALSGELSRSGINGRPPLLPPGQIALQCAIAQAAYCAVLALYNSLATGRGDHLDFSALDGAVMALDPGYGIGGSATLGRPAKLLSPERPAKGFQYPIIPCADGEVRICLLAPRQWMGLFKMMGEPPQFADAKYLRTAERYKCPDLLPAITRFFADKPRKQLEEQGQALGVPIAAVLGLDDCLNTEHIRERCVFVDVAIDEKRTAPFPNGSIEIDGERMGPLSERLDADRPVPIASSLPRPLDGLKVLDLGVIVVGAETSRLLADMGAEVVKVESLAYPDGTRESYLPIGLSAGFCAGHRNKRSLGLNLKADAGKALFARLVAKADVVLSNFKPGTMEALGLAPEFLATINPRIVLVESSAYGSTGPWAGRMGYGPLVRAASGLTRKWRYQDDSKGFSDSITIYPDHVAARLGAMSALALLIRRMRTGRGGRATISQAEVMLGHMATEIAATAVGLSGIDDFPDAPWGVWQTAGIDEWCVVTVRDDLDWNALAVAIEDPVLSDPRFSSRAGRLAARTELDALLARWLRIQDPEAVMRKLQEAGVPAARMLRVSEQPGFAYFEERGFFRTEAHPHLEDALVTERVPVRSEIIPEPTQIPAPLMGQDTFEVIRDWLGLDQNELDRLAADGVLESIAPEIRALIA